MLLFSTMTLIAVGIDVSSWDNEENLGNGGEDVECQQSTPAHNHYRGNENYIKQYNRLYFDQNIPVDSFR